MYLYIVLGGYLRILDASSVHPFAPYRYLLPTMYLFMVDIANPYLFVYGPHGRLAKKLVNRAPIAGGGKFRHKLHSRL